ncbi:MAG: flagellar basal body L-ring protein FlgH [Phycisphaerae bacterium]
MIHSKAPWVSLVLVLLQAQAFAQVSSIGARKRNAEAEMPPQIASREEPKRERNLTYERYSWISVLPAKPKTFKPGDLLTVIVRERRRYEADTDLRRKNQFDAKSELKAFVDATAGGIGAAAFQRGNPNIDYKYKSQLRKEADSEREDVLTTRLTATIIDVKPNGMLVLEARKRIQHDEEISIITLTGSCRKEDVTPGNTVLSTQLADATVSVINEGALREASKRGWITRIIDILKPF